jgi:outer membrane lipoprotein-sorting protein
MHTGKKSVISALIVLAFLPGRALFAADKLQTVLQQLDVAAANFHSTTADFEFDSVQTDPIPEKDIQNGVVYYERKGSAFQMGVHIREFNGKVVPKVLIVSRGVTKLYEKLLNQVTTFSKAAKYEDYMELGFGASGKELADKWHIKYMGSEEVDGVKTEKLELVAKDPAVLKMLPKVDVWVDTARGVSLKQVFDEGGGQSRICHYYNIKTNQPLPADAFTFKTDPKTQLIQR